MSESEKEPEHDEVYGNLNRLNRILINLDERGLILALTSFAEQALGDLLRSFLITCKAADQLLEGFNAPLGTFSARMKIAYSLGLITKRQHSDLDQLRRIRNEFAHSWETIFNDQKIISHIKALHFSGLHEEFPTSPMEKVKTSLGTLLLEFRAITHQIKQRGISSKLIGWHLVAGVVGDLDFQITLCRKRLIELADELKTARGEHRRHLLELRCHWVSKLEIVRMNAPKERQNEIKSLQAALSA